jgi:dGTPase
MDWSKLLSRKRYGAEEEEKLEEGRSPFQKDIDRIIFSNSFRRLNHKTQVHPIPHNDHIHTRLTHSLEVASVGRSLGTKVGERIQDELMSLDIQSSDLGAIVQAACLAHDIGNPPFGHSGEEAIRHWFRENQQAQMLLEDLSQNERNDFRHFEGNAQGFRIITQIEYYLFQGGMQLTYATLGTFLKYPWTSNFVNGKTKNKYGCNQSEVHVLQKVAEHLGLESEEGETCWCRHPLSYLMEAADDICYALIDLEDGIEMGFLTYKQVENIFAEVIDLKKLPPIYQDFKENDSDRRKIAIPRGKVMEVLVDGIVDTFVMEERRLLQGNFQYKDLIEACGGPVAKCINLAKNAARENIFTNPRKVRLEIGAYSIIATLLDSFLRAAWDLSKSEEGYESLSFKDKRILDLMGTNKPKPEWTLYESYMRIVDYIAGMTDNYAIYVAQQLQGMAV